MTEGLRYTSAWLHFDLDEGNFLTSPEPVEVLLELLKVGYLQGRQTTEKFELTIDAVLRYADRISWTSRTARIGLEADEIPPYESLIG